MRNYIFKLSLFFLIPYSGSAKYPASFTLIVNFPQTKGEAIYAGESYFFKEYCTANFASDSAVEQKGKYVFKGSLLYPTAIRVWGRCGKLKFNHLIFIDSGYQEIYLQQIDSSIVLSTRPKTNLEKEHQLFLQSMGKKDIDEEFDLKRLQTYVKANPTSYVALFALFTQTFEFGYRPETRAAANQFAPALRATKGYRYFADRHLVRKRMHHLTLQNVKGEYVQVDMSTNNGKYTFVELWYTGCYPCVANMTKIKESVDSGFLQRTRIISVNTDTDSITKESIAVMQKLNAPWVNYWDLNANELGKYLDKLSFEKDAQPVYPTNVLVDNKGYIVARDIDVSRIEDFIKQFTFTNGKQLNSRSNIGQQASSR